MKQLTFILAVIIALSNCCYAQLDKDELFSELKKKYSALKSAEFNFILEEQPQFSGTIKIKTGNKYILNLDKRIIYCNGTTIWNYIVNDKKVVVSNFDLKTNKELALENFLFGFLESFVPESVSRVQSSNLGSTIALLLVPKKDTKQNSYFSNIENIKSIKILVEPKQLILKQIQIKEQHSTQTFTISSLKLNVELKDEMFDFIPPKDTEIIDLR